MEEALSSFLLENRPLTHLQRRVRHFVLMCQKLQPQLSFRHLRREVLCALEQLFKGDFGKLWLRDRCFERTLRLYGKQDQRTDAWHTTRGKMITASEVSKVWQTPASRMEVLLKKLETAAAPSGNPIPALIWGTRFEAVAKHLYEKETRCAIYDVGCCVHPVHSFLGASPDGLIVPLDDDPKRYGRLVEFKCPMSRPLKDKIPIEYFHQMQMQMECTGIDECEYVEFRFKQVFYHEWTEWKEQKGIFLVGVNGKVKYDHETNWSMEKVNEDDQFVYWILTNVKKDFVAKDLEWLPSHLSELKAFWDEVVQHRENGTKPEHPTPTVAVMDL